MDYKRLTDNAIEFLVGTLALLVAGVALGTGAALVVFLCLIPLLSAEIVTTEHLFMALRIGGWAGVVGAFLYFLAHARD